MPEWAVFPLRAPSVRSGSSPCPPALLEQLGVIFAAGVEKEQECSCPGLSSVWDCTGGQRLGWSRAGCVSSRGRELGWCQPGPRTFSKSLLSSLPVQRLSLFPRGHGSGLHHFSPQLFKQLLTFDLQAFMQADDLSSPYPMWIQNMVLLPVGYPDDRLSFNVHALEIIYRSWIDLLPLLVFSHIFVLYQCCKLGT